MTFMQARTANEVLKAQERRVRLQRMKGELVDRARAIAQVFKLAREERDAWVNWPARVTAMMAAELEVDQHRLHTVLERQARGTSWLRSGRACAERHRPDTPVGCGPLCGYLGRFAPQDPGADGFLALQLRQLRKSETSSRNRSAAGSFFKIR
jgi:hypothetical protein